MQYFKSEIPFYKLKIYMQSKSMLKANTGINSAIRGSFGNQLIKLCCDKSNNDCIHCDKLKCSAKILYGTASPDDSSQQFNPYVVYCPNLHNDTNDIEFYITLFGNGTFAIKDVLTTLSKGLNVKGRLFELLSITDELYNNPVFDGFMWIMPKVYYPNFNISDSIHKLKLNFVSPFYCKQLNRTINFDYLTRCAMRRTSTILKSCSIDCTADYSQLIELSKSVLLTSADIHLTSNKRHSNRTNSDMSITGYSGNLTFKGDITPYMPFFKFCELVGIGKLCVMGLGQIECITR